MITVLVLASSPLDQGQLHLGREEKVIKQTLDSARNRDRYRVVSCMAATPDDLRVQILECSPTVVHFCGHGGGPRGLCFEDSAGNTHVVSGASLARLFHLVNEDVKCVVMNACYSDEQAREISEHIDFVVGMRDAIDDTAALKFAEGFYQAVWAGRSFEQSFKFGCSAIDMAGLPDDQTPILLRSPRLGGLHLAYDDRTQDIENFLLRYMNSSSAQRTELTVEGSAITHVVDEYYKRKIFLKWSAVSVLSVEKCGDEDLEVIAVAYTGADADERAYYLKPSGDTFRLYWKATVGYWDIPAKTLLALGAPGPVKARVVAEISDYYNFGYGPDRYVSVELSDLEGNHLAGYISRREPQVTEILRLLRDGREHRITLLIQSGPPGQRTAEIVSVLSDSWVLAGEAE